MEQRADEHSMFAYDTFIQNRRYCVHFNLGRRGAVPGRNTMLRWVHILWETESIMKKKPPDPTKNVRKPENI